MPGGSDDPRRGLRVALHSSVMATEEGRAFFQDRLSIFGLCIFLLAGGFWLLETISLLIIHFRTGEPIVTEQSTWDLQGRLRLTATGVCGLIWLLTRRGRRSAGLLRALEFAGVLLTVGCFQVGGALLDEPMPAAFIITLTTYSVMVTRAIVVPSTARTTFAITTAAAATMVYASVWRFSIADAPEGAVGAAGFHSGLWGSVLVAICTVASRTIFGLRREIGEARVLGQYTLEKKIGAGGMGEVWRARHAMLRRRTAVKILPPERAGEASLRRFEREVRLTARLTHPNTVAVFDYGRTPDGALYYAMELIDGMDLERLVAADGPQPPERVVHLLTQICGALAEAHDIGLVHRDVKPANILVVPRNEEPEVAKIVDFGLVKDLDQTQEMVTLSGSNTITGTPLYLSPEAITQPETIDGRADLYALGAVGWFLLVGRPPFVADTIVEVCSQHLHTPAPIPPSSRHGPVPADLQDVLLACLQKDRARRPASARALRQALAACSCAGAWTAERSAQWWSSHQAEPPPSAGEPSPEFAQTLAIDLAQRRGA